MSEHVIVPEPPAGSSAPPPVTTTTPPSYVLIGSSSVVQVLSTTVAQQSVVATIQTIPSNVVAATAVSQTSFDANAAAETLTALADNIEAIIAQGKAIGGTGTSDLDASGLTVYYVTFTVGYNPPNAPTGTVTVDVDVPVNLLNVDDPTISRTLVTQAEATINKAYNSLVALSKG